MTLTSHAGGRAGLWHGDCMHLLAALGDSSVDAIVTDPPYGLGFMGKKWDALPPGEDWARECLRVLKPGGHLLAFGGSRTWHRLAVAIEDGGFEIRDSIAWLYGSGFPKSLDVSKAIDRGTGENHARQLEFTAWMRSTGITAAQINAATDSFMGSHYLTDRKQAAIATAEMFDRLRSLLPEIPERIERLVAERTGIEWTDYVNRPVVNERFRAATGRAEQGTGGYAFGEHFADTSAATDESARWQGWGTALKPAFEPIVVARKPLSGTVAANVLEYGTGALNIDGCRIETTEDTRRTGSAPMRAACSRTAGRMTSRRAEDQPERDGRWPANVVLDESQAAALDEQSGYQRDGVATNRNRDVTATKGSIGIGRQKVGSTRDVGYGGGGGASRYFYVAKAPKSERPSYHRQSCECEDAWPVTASRARATGETTEPGSSSTLKRGSATTADPSLTDTRSTTSTATSSTTTRATSSPSRPPTTSESTPGANFETASGGSPAVSAETSSPSASVIGTSAAKAGPSTDAAGPATSPEWSPTSVCGRCGAPSKLEAHATVKPLALMRWVARLVTPPGGLVLDTFAGSGTTGEAALLEGFRVLLAEAEADYLPLIAERLRRVELTDRGAA